MQQIRGRGGAVQLNDDDGRVFVQVCWQPQAAQPAGVRVQPEMATAEAWNVGGGQTMSRALILVGGGA